MSAIEDHLVGAEALLVSIPPDAERRSGSRALRGGDRERAPRLPGSAISRPSASTAITAGGWVDETSRVQPRSDALAPAASRRSEAWLAFGRRTGKAVAVFRLAGIYGPGRNALKNLADGTARRIVKPGQVFNRIHVDDIAAALARLDRETARRRDLQRRRRRAGAAAGRRRLRGANLLGIAPPPGNAVRKAEFEPDGARASTARTSASRTASSGDELGVALTLPDLSRGAARAVRGGGGRSGGA